MLKTLQLSIIFDIYIYLLSVVDLVYNLGCAWLRVGGLRYHLLITCDDLDPALKYSLKYSNLVQKIALLELENDVCFSPSSFSFT